MDIVAKYNNEKINLAACKRWFDVVQEEYKVGMINADLYGKAQDVYREILDEFKKVEAEYLNYKKQWKETIIIE